MNYEDEFYDVQTPFMEEDVDMDTEIALFIED